LILKFAGRIVYHLSASNWTVVLQRIRQKIRFLANSVDDNPDIVDLSLMKHSSLDRTRLIQILQGMFRNILCGAYLFGSCTRTVVAASQHETRDQSRSCCTTAYCYLELDQHVPRRV
jgi:hypothetical protein